MNVNVFPRVLKGYNNFEMFISKSVGNLNVLFNPQNSPEGEIRQLSSWYRKGKKRGSKAHYTLSSISPRGLPRQADTPSADVLYGSLAIGSFNELY